MNMQLPHMLDRSVWIRAPREVVFAFFQDADRWAAWWGAGSEIDARPGGKMSIRYPNGVAVAGEVLEVAAPERIQFTYGYKSGQPVAEGSTLVTITLSEERGGTRLELRHEFAEAPARDTHVQGWRYQLSVFANVVADANFTSAESVVDEWFEAWAETNDLKRAERFAAIAGADVVFRDRWSCLEGREDLIAHAGAALKFMPGVRLARKGPVRHCQGILMVDWSAGEKMHGTNIFVLGPNGLVESVTGFAL
jgi:uncharacterized protein YndB with AHSA1/START domain